MPQTTDVSPLLRFVSELGGWGALVLFVAGFMWLAWRGGSAFMGLARSFSDKVVQELSGIRLEVAKHNERLENLDDRLQQVDQRVGTLTDEVRRQSAEIAHYHRKVQ